MSDSTKSIIIILSFLVLIFWIVLYANTPATPTAYPDWRAKQQEIIKNADKKGYRTVKSGEGICVEWFHDDGFYNRATVSYRCFMPWKDITDEEIKDKAQDIITKYEAERDAEKAEQDAWDARLETINNGLNNPEPQKTPVIEEPRPERKLIYCDEAGQLIIRILYPETLWPLGQTTTTKIQVQQKAMLAGTTCEDYLNK